MENCAEADDGTMGPGMRGQVPPTAFQELVGVQRVVDQAKNGMCMTPGLQLGAGPEDWRSGLDETSPGCTTSAPKLVGASSCRIAIAKESSAAAEPGAAALGPSASALGLTGSTLCLAVLRPCLTAPGPSGLDIWLSNTLCPAALGLPAAALRRDEGNLDQLGIGDCANARTELVHEGSVVFQNGGLGGVYSILLCKRGGGFGVCLGAGLGGLHRTAEAGSVLGADMDAALRSGLGLASEAALGSTGAAACKVGAALDGSEVPATGLGPELGTEIGADLGLILGPELGTGLAADLGCASEETELGAALGVHMGAEPLERTLRHGHCQVAQQVLQGRWKQPLQLQHRQHPWTLQQQQSQMSF
ncbi:MAG: hypothetical protein FRX49_11615 [Trebouxia sp. A1-2]|nr:MAG: hypothetical protein FRX49_11615 [Trebouxia sp. A1-2]